MTRTDHPKTAAEWSTLNPVLREGEYGVESDTGKHKFGNGFTPWNELSGFFPGGGSDSAAEVFDTQWRYMEPGHNTGAPALNYYYRRVGDDVTLLFPATNKDLSYTENAIPFGIRPDIPPVGGTMQMNIPYHASGGVTNSMYVFFELEEPGMPAAIGNTSGSTFGFFSPLYAFWRTADPIPTTILGTVVPDPF